MSFSALSPCPTRSSHKPVCIRERFGDLHPGCDVPAKPISRPAEARRVVRTTSGPSAVLGARKNGSWRFWGVACLPLVALALALLFLAGCDVGTRVDGGETVLTRHVERNDGRRDDDHVRIIRVNLPPADGR